MAMIKDVCPQHSDATEEQIREVLSRLSDGDLSILNDAPPHTLYSELSAVAGARLLHRMAVAQARVHRPLT
jgi:hypothetical protein